MRYLILTDTGVVLGWTTSKPIAIRMFETFCKNSNIPLTLEEYDEEDQSTILKRTP